MNKKISSSNITTQDSSDNISFKVFYDEVDPVCIPDKPNTSLPNIQESEITEEVKSKDFTSFLEGELGVSLRTGLVDLEIDIDGNLILRGEDCDSYSINVDGDLEYDLCL